MNSERERCSIKNQNAADDKWESKDLKGVIVPISAGNIDNEEFK